MPEDDPLLVGLLRIINGLIDDSVDAVALPTITPDQRTYNAGRIAGVTDVRTMIAQAWKDSRAPKPEVKPPK